MRRFKTLITFSVSCSMWFWMFYQLLIQIVLSGCYDCFAKVSTNRATNHQCRTASSLSLYHNILYFILLERAGVGCGWNKYKKFDHIQTFICCHSKTCVPFWSRLYTSRFYHIKVSINNWLIQGLWCSGNGRPLIRQIGLIMITRCHDRRVAFHLVAPGVFVNDRQYR